MKNLKILYILVIFTCIVFATIFGFVACKQGEKTALRIGAILPLTGPAAYIGKWHKDGFELAVKHINDEFKGKKIEIIYEDSQNDPKTGINAFRNLRFKNTYVCISAMSSVTLPLIPFLDSEKQYTFVTSVSYPEVAKKSNYLYRYNITADKEALEIANYLISDLKKKKINIFYINDEYGISAYEVIKKQLEIIGGHIEFSSQFSKSDLDFRMIIMKSKFDLPYVILGYGSSYTTLLTQLIQIVKNPLIISDYSMDIPQFIQPLIGTGVQVSYARVKRLPDEYKKFEEMFENTFNYKPNYVNVLCYDLVHIIYIISSEIGSFDKEKVAKYGIRLRSAYGYDIKILPDGEIEVPVEIVKKTL